MLVDKNGDNLSMLWNFRILKFMIGYKLYFNFPKGRKAQNFKTTGHPLISLFGEGDAPPANGKITLEKHTVIDHKIVKHLIL